MLVQRLRFRAKREPADRCYRENSNTAANSNSNTAETTNANSNSTEPVDAPPPADRDQVMAQLQDLENEWTVANLNADKKKLDRILADDYVGQANEEGGPGNQSGIHRESNV